MSSMDSKKVFSELKKRDLFIVAFFLIVSFLLLAWSSNFNFSLLIDGGDTDFFLNPILEIKKALFTLKNDGFGAPEYFPFVKFFLALPAAVVYFFTQNIYITNWIYFTVLFALPGIFMYKYLLLVGVGKRLSLLGATFYAFNQYVYLRFHTPIIHIQWAYAALPLLLMIMSRIYKTGLAFNYLAAYSLVFISIFWTFNLYLVYFILVPVLAFLVLKSLDQEIKIKPQTLLKFFIVFGLINIVAFAVLYTSIANYQDQYSGLVLNLHYRESSKVVSSGYNIFHTLAGWGTYAWNQSLSEERAGWQSFAIFRNLSKQTLVVIGLMIPTLVLLLNISKRRWFIVVGMFLCGFLMTAFGWPFGDIYESIFRNIPSFFDLFRDSWGYWSIPYFLILTIGLVLGLHATAEVGSILRKFAFLTYLILFVFLFVAPGNLINKRWFVSVPDGYFKVSEYINTNYSNENILVLPLTDHNFGYTFYQWGYGGPDVMNKLIDASYIDKYVYPVTIEPYIADLEKLVDGGVEDIEKYIVDKSIAVLVLRKDLSNSSDVEKSAQLGQLFDESICFEKVYSTNSLDLYSYKCRNRNIEDVIANSECVVAGSSRFSSTYIIDGASYESSCQESVFLNFDNEGIRLERDKLEVPIEVENEQLFTVSEEIEDVNIQVNNSDVEVGERLLAKEGDVFEVTLDKDNDLIENYDFTLEDWHPDGAHTCDADTSEIGIKYQLQDDSSVLIESPGKQVCMFNSVELPSEGNGLLINVKHRSSSDQSLGHCLLSDIQQQCLSYGALDETPDLLNIDFTSKRFRYVEGDYYDDYIFIPNFEGYLEDDKLFLSVYFNQGEEDNFKTEVSEIRVVQIPAEWGDIVFNADDINSEVSIPQYKSFLGETVWKVSDIDNESKLLVLDKLYSDNWKVFTVENGLPKMQDNEHVLFNGYGNGWITSRGEYDTVYFVYMPQVWYMFGLFLSSWAMVSYIGIKLWGRYRSK
jgi:hypothetical protein